MAIDMVRMPPEVSYGFAARFNFGNEIVQLPDGEGREAVRMAEMPSRSWTARKGVFTRARANEFVGFARARHGGFYGFRFWDPTDFSTHPTDPANVAWTMTDQFLGEGNGTRTRFPMRRTYRSVPNELLQRLAVEDRMLPLIGEIDDRLASKVGLPAGSTLTSAVSVDGVSVPFSFDFRAREFVLASAPGVGTSVMWGGLYDYPAGFDQATDANLERIAESFEGHSIPAIGLDLLAHDRFCPESDDPGGCASLAWSTGVPLIQKAVRKTWLLSPAGASQSVQIEDVSRHNAGGPHLVLVNIAANSVTVLDSLSGSTMFTLGASGSGTAVARLWSRDNGPTLQWFFTLGA